MPKKYSRFGKKSLNNNGKILTWLKNHSKIILISTFIAFLVFTLTFSVISIEKAKKTRHLNNVYVFTLNYKDETYLSQIEGLKAKHKDYVANIYVCANNFSALTMKFKIPEHPQNSLMVVQCVLIEKPFGEFMTGTYDTSIEKVEEAILNYAYERI